MLYLGRSPQGYKVIRVEKARVGVHPAEIPLSAWRGLSHPACQPSTSLIEQLPPIRSQHTEPDFTT